MTTPNHPIVKEIEEIEKEINLCSDCRELIFRKEAKLEGINMGLEVINSQCVTDNQNKVQKPSSDGSQKSIDNEQEKVEFGDGIESTNKDCLAHTQVKKVEVDSPLKSPVLFDEFVEKLKEKVMRQGNLSNRVVVDKYGYYVPIRDAFLNTIVTDIIDDLAKEYKSKMELKE